MGLRPASASREVKGQPWARISKRRPRKSYVKGAPQPKIRQFIMGTDKPYEVEVDLVTVVPIQIRDNAFESARQACNKFLEKKLLQNYFMQVAKYPHLVLRESASLGVAGADRISKGMKRAFGKPKGRLARLKANETVFRVRCHRKNLPAVKQALDRANIKLPGKMKLVVIDISNEVWNLTKKEVVFAKKEEAKPEAAAAATAEAPAAATEAGKGAPAKAEEKTEAKPAGKKK